MAAKDTQQRDFNLLDNLLEGCQIIDYEWRYLYLNDAAIVHARMSREDLIGRTMMECYPGIENTELFAVLERVMHDRIDARIDNEFTYPDGKTGWFELHAEPWEEGILILSQDITARKLAMQAAQMEIKRLDTLRQIDLAITSSVDLAVVGDIVLDRVVDSLAVDAAALLLFDEDTLAIATQRARGFAGETHEVASIKIGEGIAGVSARTRETVIIDDLAVEPGFIRRGLVERHGFVSYFARPLMERGKILGVLELFHRQKKEYDQSWLDFFEIIAGQAAIAISHIQTYGNLQNANVDLLLAYDLTIQGWAKALELRDIETEGHSRRVTEVTDRLARRMNYKKEDLVHIRRGALLHDIGKLGIPDAILHKPDKLSDSEWETMRQHPAIGYKLLSQIDFLGPALDVVRYHHEKWDGSGYPRGLDGDIIPLSARIFAIADVWDALRSDRPYRPAWDDERALEYIKSESGKHFDPEVVEAFLKEVAE
jgi:putative nucleotidyltransferase with HDIG domain/PAS domain S-box-containing protein